MNAPARHAASTGKFGFGFACMWGAYGCRAIRPFQFLRFMALSEKLEDEPEDDSAYVIWMT